MTGSHDLVLQALIERFKPRPDYRREPKRWMNDRLGEWAWSKQDEIMQSVVENTYTAVHSCHDAGKSFIASRIINHWIDSRPIGEAFVVSTAPSAAQVSAVLWREVTKAHIKAKAHSYPMPGRINRAGYPQWVADGLLIGYGRKPADYQDSAFQGIHDTSVLVVLDEAGGVPRNIWDGADALTTNEDVRILAIGNPDQVGTHFHQVCSPLSKAGHGWNKIRIDALETPNMNREYIQDCLDRGVMTEEDVEQLDRVMREAGVEYSTEWVPEPLRKMLVSPKWVSVQSVRWGTNSSLFKAKVRGEFPDEASEGVIPLSWIKAAMTRWQRWKDSGSPVDWSGRRVFGVDVARYGEDSTVIARRTGDIVEELLIYQQRDTQEVADLVKEAAGVDPDQQAEIAHTMFVVDANGIGGGVVDRLRRDGVANIVGFVGSERDGRKDRTGSYDFRNNRHAAYWNLREALDPAFNSKVCIPNDPQLEEELAAPRWDTQEASARIYVETDKEVRKRLGRSPDRAVAVLLAFWFEASALELQGGDPVDWESNTDGDVIAWEDPNEIVDDPAGVINWS